jgi:hypothetical protein
MATVAVFIALGGTALASAMSAKSGAPTTRAPKISLGTAHRYTYLRKHFTNLAHSVDQGVVSCGRHQVAVGGGGLSPSPGGQSLTSSYPHDNGDRGEVPDGWAIFMDNTTGENLDAYVYAVCRRVR